MASIGSGEVTRLLGEAGHGDRAASAHLVEVLRDELQDLAGHMMRRQQPGHTLQATALVHEMYLRISAGPSLVAENRTHFLAIAARAMRQILARHAKGKRALKRGGGGGRLSFSLDLAAPEAPDDSVAMDTVLERLAVLNARQASVIEMRFFADMTNGEIAEALSVSIPTVERDWRMARAWMRVELAREGAQARDVEQSGS